MDLWQRIKSQKESENNDFSWMTQEEFQQMMSDDYYGLFLPIVHSKYDLTACLPYCHEDHVESMIEYGADPREVWKICTKLAKTESDLRKKAVLYRTASRLMEIETNV